MTPKRTPVPPRKKKPPKRMPAPLREQEAPSPATPEAAQAAEALPKRTGSEPPGPPPTDGDPNLPENRTALYRYLRYAAGMYYTTDLRGCTLEQLHRHPMFRVMSFHTIAKWAVEDRWTERRQINLEQWRRAIENKIGTELAQAYRTGLSKATRVFDMIFEKIENEVVEPKSLEGLVTAFVKLADLMGDWNERIGKLIIPDMPAQQAMVAGPAEQAKPQLSQEEARAAAKLLIEMRRKEMRAKAARAARGEEDDAETLGTESGD